MDSQIAILIELQKADTAIRGIGIQKGEMPKRFAVLDDERKHVEVTLAKAAASVAELTQGHKEKESALVKASEELRKTKSKQFEVKTNREFEAVLKEIETIEIKIGRIEEEIILTLDEIEQAKAELATNEAKHKEFIQKYDRCREELAVVSRAHDDDLASLADVQQALKSSLPVEIVKKYEAIKTLYPGLAVVSVVNGVCQGCFINIPPQMNNELMGSKEVRTCPRCNRIVFFQQAAES